MKEKRLVFVFGAALLSFMVLLCRVWNLSLHAGYAAAAERQASCVLPFAQGRGDFYDRNGRRLTGNSQQIYTVAQPGGEDYQLLYEAADEQDRARLYQNRLRLYPSLIQLQNPQEDTAIFQKPKRYALLQPAVHTIGYLNGEGRGVSGGEYVFDRLLSRGGDRSEIRCSLRADGGLQTGTVPEEYMQTGTGEGVQLTLDFQIQRICEDVAEEMLPRGAIVVMDCQTGEILASVSMPRFSQETVSESLQKQDTALINRAVSPYNVGSVFKPFLAALALEEGIDPKETYQCKGSIEVDGQVYHCAFDKAHGEVDMEKALEQSCNCYFIHLGQQLDQKHLCHMAELLGMGLPTPLGGGMKGAAGCFPSEETLQNSGELSVLCFGQGKLLMTPVQLAAYFNTFAADGVYHSPTLAKGIWDADREEIKACFQHPAEVRLLSEKNNQKLVRMLKSVVYQGLAQKADPSFLTAAGKTGTAQTGRTKEMEDGSRQELYNSWFAGFYPAAHPRYTIVVLKDDITDVKDDGTAVFAALCNRFYYYDRLWEESALDKEK